MPLLLRRLALTAMFLGCVSLACANDTAPPLSAQQAAQDVRVLSRSLTALHPALTKYRTQAEIDAALAHFKSRGEAARSAAEMFLAATELAAAIRCGHTWTNPRNQGGAAAALADAANKLPFTMRWVQGRWLVLASADPAVAAGDELLALNGWSAADWAREMWPYLRADGASDNKRWRQLSHDRFDASPMDSIAPLLSPPTQGRWQVKLRSAAGTERDAWVAATTLPARQAMLAAQGVKPLDEAWSLRIDGDMGVLRLPTFAFWNSKFDWAHFIDDSFAELRQRQVPNLVIDIRDNEGGDGQIGGKLLAHLIRAPFSFTSDQSITTYERVPYALARYLDTWDFSFFDRTGQVEKVLEGTAAGKYRVKGRTRIETIQPVATPFSGRVYLLVGGENSSATFQFAHLAQRAGAATLVGQATGGNLRGLNGGQLTWVTLPHSGVSVDIPLLAASYTDTTPDASVIPDILVERLFEAVRSGRDLEMEAVKQIVLADRKSASATAPLPAPPDDPWRSKR